MGGALPHGWSTFKPEQIGVTDRQLNVVENEDDIRVWLQTCAEAGTVQPVTACAYCADRSRGRTLKAVLYWFQQHPCAEPFAQIAAKRARAA